MAGEIWLTRDECAHVLRLVNQLRWQELAATETAAKLAPLASMGLQRQVPWQELSEAKKPA